MTPSESNSDQLSVRLLGKRPVSLAVDAARRFGTAQKLDKEDLARLCIVIEELIANLYDHGGVSEQDEVQLDISGDRKGIRIALNDPGTPFNSWSIQSSIHSASRGGGAGIRLIQAWATLISYRTSGGRNQLELLLPARRNP